MIRHPGQFFEKHRTMNEHQPKDPAKELRKNLSHSHSPRLFTRSDTTAMHPPHDTPPTPARRERRLSLQPQKTCHPGLSPPPSRAGRRSPSPNKSKTTASTPTKSGSSNMKHKVVMLGPAKVGKTSIIDRFLDDAFNPKYKPTLDGIRLGDFSISGADLHLEILDTAGSHEFPAMKKINISQSNYFILVYAIDDKASFDEILVLRNEVVQEKGETIPLVVVGNKMDLPERTVDENAEKVIARWKHGYVECSAKTGEGVSNIFKELLNQANVQYRLSPALRKRRLSLPASGNSHHPTVVRNQCDLTPAQLASLREKHSKRNSCAIS